MILNVSGRTDIVAFYTPWFMNRIEEGFIDVRNPFYPKKVSRIYFEDVEAIVFCTKNPIPIVKYLDKIKKPILFHVTLTPYGKDIEPNVPPKGQIIKSIYEISSKVGIENLYIRYDPIIVNERYTIDYHIQAFSSLCKHINGYVKHIIVSFLDDYKNVQKNKNILKNKMLTEEDYKKIGTSFSCIAKLYNIEVQTCFEERNLVEYGFIKSECLSKQLAYKLTGKTNFKKWQARKCSCVEMVDIGVYNTCKHFCKYCYANYDEKKVNENHKNHDPNSTMLIGYLEMDDIIKRRKR